MGATGSMRHPLVVETGPVIQTPALGLSIALHTGGWSTKEQKLKTIEKEKP
jgi:hypothetical protein